MIYGHFCTDWTCLEGVVSLPLYDCTHTMPVIIISVTRSLSLKKTTKRYQTYQNETFYDLKALGRCVYNLKANSNTILKDYIQMKKK